MKKILILALLSACQMTPIDPSIKAIDAMDLTLAMSACNAMPGLGADICHVKEGATISATWKIIMPKSPKLLGGEINVYYKDISKSYALTGSVVEIPWKDLVGHDTWELEDEGEALALAQIRFKDPQGIISVVRAKGLAILLVTKTGYDLLPIDSGFEAFSTTCRIQYSTAGRSAISCK